MANRKIKMDLKNLLRFLIESTPVDTGRKLNVHKTFRRRPVCFLNVQFASCVYEDAQCLLLYRIWQHINWVNQTSCRIFSFVSCVCIIPLSDNPTKLSNTPKQFVSWCQRIVWVLFDHFLGLTLKRLTII